MSHLLISREGRVLRLTLNYVEKNNVLDEDLCRDLVETMRYAGKDQGLGCILVDAQGPVFCAGFDYDELLTPIGVELTPVHAQLLSFGLQFHKPIVGAVQGPACGAGVALLANCHIVIAAREATFGLNEIHYGHWPFVAHRALALALGERRVVELALTGARFSAADARQWGLVHELAAREELDGRASQVARALATGCQETLRRGLDFVSQSREMSAVAAARLAGEARARTLRSADFYEGVCAMKDRRQPAWPSLDPERQSPSKKRKGREA